MLGIRSWWVRGEGEVVRGHKSFVLCPQRCYPGRFLFVTVLKVLKVSINNRLLLNAADQS